MHPLGYLILGFAPGLFWLWVTVSGNRQRPDPTALVVRTFLLGIAVALPIVLLEEVVGGDLSMRPNMPVAEAAILAFVVAGLVEEFGKFLVVRLSLYDSPYFDEPLRGLVYASASALGFASIENVGYMLTYGPEVIAPRALLSTLGHVFFASLWGYGLGADRQAQLQGKPSRGYAALGLFGGIAAHGAYDFGIFVERPELALLAFVAVGGGCIALFVNANRSSVHRGRTAAPFVECGKCRAPSPFGKRFCAACGAPIARDLERRCGGCKAPLLGESAYCSGCGVRVEVE